MRVLELKTIKQLTSRFQYITRDANQVSVLIVRNAGRSFACSRPTATSAAARAATTTRLNETKISK